TSRSCRRDSWSGGSGLAACGFAFACRRNQRTRSRKRHDTLCRTVFEECMITKITGILNRVLDEEVRLQVGPLEYQLLVPEFVRRQVQTRLGQEVTLHTSEYLDGNPMQGRVVPRLIGFHTEAELEFFELFCTVDKVGTRKAIKALIRPIRDIADAIQRQ